MLNRDPYRKCPDCGQKFFLGEPYCTYEADSGEIREVCKTCYSNQLEEQGKKDRKNEKEAVPVKLWVVFVADNNHDDPSVYLVAAKTEKQAERIAKAQHRSLFPEMKKCKVITSYTFCAETVPGAKVEYEVVLRPVGA